MLKILTFSALQSKGEFFSSLQLEGGTKGGSRLIKFPLQHVCLINKPRLGAQREHKQAKKTKKQNAHPESATRLTLPVGQRLMNDYFSVPAGAARSPAATRLKETQFRRDKSQGDNLR